MPNEDRRATPELLVVVVAQSQFQGTLLQINPNIRRIKGTIYHGGVAFCKIIAYYIDAAPLPPARSLGARSSPSPRVQHNRQERNVAAGWTRNCSSQTQTPQIACSDILDRWVRSQSSWNCSSEASADTAFMDVERRGSTFLVGAGARSMVPLRNTSQEDMALRGWRAGFVLLLPSAAVAHCDLKKGPAPRAAWL